MHPRDNEVREAALRLGMTPEAIRARIRTWGDRERALTERRTPMGTRPDAAVAARKEAALSAVLDALADERPRAESQILALTPKVGRRRVRIALATLVGDGRVSVEEGRDGRRRYRIPR